MTIAFTQPRSHPLIVDPLPARLTGAARGSTITIEAIVTGYLGTNWRARACYEADADGVVDVGRQAPVEGAYAGVDGRGLLWSAVPDADPILQPITADSMLTTTVRALDDDGDVLDTMTLKRGYRAPGVERIEVDTDGIVGTLFVPAGDVVRPGVVTLSGSEGGIKETRAALLASHGHPTLALAYFGVAGTPAALSEIPLESLERGIRWLLDHERVAGDRVVVEGGSRGGELALVLGATFPRLIDGVIAHVPSGLIWGGVTAEDPPSYTAGWTYEGTALPHIEMIDMGEAMSIGRTSTLFERTLAEKADELHMAEIAVERIDGPVLLLSGTDDAVWPSTPLADIAERRLHAHDHRHEVVHMAYEHAGHSFGNPGAPTTITSLKHPQLPLTVELGGVPHANAAAAADAWGRVLAFLERGR